MEETISKDNILISHKKAAQERRLQKKREVDRAYYLQNREKKIAQVKQRRQAKRELLTRPSRTRCELKRDQEADQIKEKRRSIRDSVQAKRALIREQTRERESENIVKDRHRRTMWKKFWAGAPHFRTGRRKNARLIR